VAYGLQWHFVTEDAYDSMIEIAILFYERFEELGRHVEQPNNGMHLTPRHRASHDS